MVGMLIEIKIQLKFHSNVKTFSFNLKKQDFKEVYILFYHKTMHSSMVRSHFSLPAYIVNK